MRPHLDLLLAATLLTLIPACGNKAGEQSKEAAVTWPEKPTDGTPVVWQFVKLQGTGADQSATMRVFNFTDKDVKSVRLTLNYLDESGKELGDFPWGISEGLGLVKAKGTAVEDKMGFNFPAGTETVTADVHGVTFADGSEWNRPE